MYIFIALSQTSCWTIISWIWSVWTCSAQLYTNTSLAERAFYWHDCLYPRPPRDSATAISKSAIHSQSYQPTHFTSEHPTLLSVLPHYLRSEPDPHTTRTSFPGLERLALAKPPYPVPLALGNPTTIPSLHHHYHHHLTLRDFKHELDEHAADVLVHTVSTETYLIRCTGFDRSMRFIR